ncbi:MAG: glycosyltransferase family 4 protein [Candidatus Saccharimonadales bacterium]
MGSNSKHIVIDARIRRSSTGRYVDRLLEHLQTIDSPHRFTVLVQPDDPWRARAANFEVQSSPYPQFSFNPLNDFKFAYQLRSLQPDLVHFTMTQQPLTYRGRTVTTTHDLTMLRFIRAGKTAAPVFWLKKFGYRLMFYVAHQKSARIIVPTKFVGHDLAKLYPFTKKQISVTYEASEPPINQPAEPLDGVKKPFIMHVGSPFPHKNLQHLIKAFELLLKRKPGLTLVLAGKKEFYFEELQEWAQQRSAYPSIRFTGFIDDNELKWLYENAEAYVLPSLSEGFGLPGLEAMSHGCAVVSSDATCLPEVYGDAAHYFDPYNLQQTAAAIEDVLDSPKLRAMLRTEGYKQLQKYSWQTMAEQTHDVYNRALRA